VFFDVGQTLLTPAISEATVFTEAAARVGVTLDPADVERHMPAVYRHYEELYEEDDTFWSDDTRATQIWIEMYRYLCELVGLGEHGLAIGTLVHERYFTAASWKPYDEVIPTLEALQRRGIRMGLISNWDSSLEDVITGLGMSRFFSVIISSAVVRLHKPMPEIFELALERMGAVPEESMHVGDHLYADVAGARQAGITPVYLDRDGSGGGDAGLIRIEGLDGLLSII
jgi:putative hydrolase of the HAD superfamily